MTNKQKIELKKMELMVDSMKTFNIAMGTLGLFLVIFIILCATGIIGV